MADDVAGLIEQLGGAADVLGYSLGGEVALRLAIQHPALVRNLVVISVACRRDGNHPEVVAAFDAMSPAAAEMMKQGPAYPAYTAIAPRPEDFDTMVAKTAELLQGRLRLVGRGRRRSPRARCSSSPTPTRSAPTTSSSSPACSGSGCATRAGTARRSPRTSSPSCPASTHYDILASPLLAPVVTAFLG